MNVDMFFPLMNGCITIFFGLTIIYYILHEKIMKHPILYAWGLGFILYGIQIIVRTFMHDKIFIFIVGVPFYFLFTFGTWGLLKRKYFLYATFLIIIPLTLIWFSTLPLSIILTIMALSFNGLMTVGMIYNKIKFGKVIDKLLFGWFLLLLANLFLFKYGLLCDLFALYGKFILFLGVLDQNFAILIKEIRRGLAQHHLSITSGNIEDGGIKLVMLNSNNVPSIVKTSEWLKNEIEENIDKKIETNLIVLCNIIPFNVLRSILWSEPELIHIFILSQNYSNNKEFKTLEYGITELGAVITEISREYAKYGRRGEIILIDLSILIHTFGANEVYGLLLNKLGNLRTSGTSLITLIHPNTHEESVLALFKAIADEIIKI